MDENILAKTYDPKDFEDRLYQFWEAGNYFSPAQEPQGDPFVVVIPPPNVTGVLHMGHGLNNCLQDIVIRYQRMKGRDTLWVPGTDHAGIATQQVVERRLQAQGRHRRDMEREEFLDITWKVKEEHHSIITRQLKKIGASVDWSRERFTLDEGLSHAVRKVFVDLYKKGLVYKGHYLVNWDPEAQTAIADDEVEYKEVQGALYHVRYPFKDGSGFVEIATTRPETMLGDVAVAVHPDDERYAGLHGKILVLPIVGREIPLLADGFVDREFGTGAVKITPAHDQNDFDMGRRHDLPQINILNPDGTLGPNVPEDFKGLTVKAARKKMVGLLKEGEFLIKEEPHKHQVGHCYRSGAVIEPYLSEQWFVKMAPMAEKALKALHDGDIRFFPQRWEHTYTHWLSNIRDWCISRQLWWGHQIPAWTCSSCGQIHVEMEAPGHCSACGSADLKQDPDVLDTWFSSWLWPFSVMGWPQKTADLERFYPTTALVTGFDIIFFWVARMIMAGLEFTGKAPFKDIYLHQLVRDKQGQKMSKSKGNGIDPLDVVDEYGADALKFTLGYLAAQGQDILLDRDAFKLGSKFANKVWNASRYLLMNLPEGELPRGSELVLGDMDRWILHRLDLAVEAIDRAMADYRFNDAAHVIYDYFWNDFCDWYIEASKMDLYSQDELVKRQAAGKLVSLLEETLRLMHPFLPFLTEELYQKLPSHGESIMVSAYPQVQAQRRDPQGAQLVDGLQELIRAVRTLRSEFLIPQGRTIDLMVNAEDPALLDILKRHEELLRQFVSAGTIEFGNGRLEGDIGLVGKGWQARARVKELIDVPRQMARLEKEMGKFQGLIKAIRGKLDNERFVANAPEELVAQERQKLEDYSRTLATMEAHLKELAE